LKCSICSYNSTTLIKRFDIFYEVSYVCYDCVMSFIKGKYKYEYGVNSVEYCSKCFTKLINIPFIKVSNSYYTMFFCVACYTKKENYGERIVK
jgi:hypothetical protein